MTGNKRISDLVKVLFGQKKLSIPKEMNEIIILDESLNDIQKQAVRFTLGSPELSLIHGPPGKVYIKISNYFKIIYRSNTHYVNIYLF